MHIRFSRPAFLQPLFNIGKSGLDDASSGNTGPGNASSGNAGGRALAALLAVTLIGLSACNISNSNYSRVGTPAPSGDVAAIQPIQEATEEQTALVDKLITQTARTKELTTLNETITDQVAGAPGRIQAATTTEQITTEKQALTTTLTKAQEQLAHNLSFAPAPEQSGQSFGGQSFGALAGSVSGALALVEAIPTNVDDPDFNVADFNEAKAAAMAALYRLVDIAKGPLRAALKDAQEELAQTNKAVKDLPVTVRLQEETTKKLEAELGVTTLSDATTQAQTVTTQASEVGSETARAEQDDKLDTAKTTLLTDQNTPQEVKDDAEAVYHKLIQDEIRTDLEKAGLGTSEKIAGVATQIRNDSLTEDQIAAVDAIESSKEVNNKETEFTGKLNRLLVIQAKLKKLLEGPNGLIEKRGLLGDAGLPSGDQDLPLADLLPRVNESIQGLRGNAEPNEAGVIVPTPDSALGRVDAVRHRFALVAEINNAIGAANLTGDDADTVESKLTELKSELTALTPEQSTKTEGFDESDLDAAKNRKNDLTAVANGLKIEQGRVAAVLNTIEAKLAEITADTPQHREADTEVQKVRAQRDDINQRLGSLLGTGTVAVPAGDSLLALANELHRRINARLRRGDVLAELNGQIDAIGQASGTADAKDAAEAASNDIDAVTAGDVDAATGKAQTARTKAQTASAVAKRKLDALKTAITQLRVLLDLPTDDTSLTTVVNTSVVSVDDDVDTAKNKANTNQRNVSTKMNSLVTQLGQKKNTAPADLHNQIDRLIQEAGNVTTAFANANEAWGSAQDAWGTKLPKVVATKGRIEKLNAIKGEISNAKLTGADAGTVESKLAGLTLDADTERGEITNITGFTDADLQTAKSKKTALANKANALKAEQNRVNAVLNGPNGNDGIVAKLAQIAEGTPQHREADAEIKKVRDQRDDIDRRLTLLLGTGTVEAPAGGSLLQATNERIETIELLLGLGDGDGEKTAEAAKAAAKAASNNIDVEKTSVAAARTLATRARTKAQEASAAAKGKLDALKIAITKLREQLQLPAGDTSLTVDLEIDDLSAGDDAASVDTAKGKANTNQSNVSTKMTALKQRIQGNKQGASKAATALITHIEGLADSVTTAFANANEAWGFAQDAWGTKLPQVIRIGKLNDINGEISRANLLASTALTVDSEAPGEEDASTLEGRLFNGDLALSDDETEQEAIDNIAGFTDASLQTAERKKTALAKKATDLKTEQNKVNAVLNGPNGDDGILAKLAEIAEGTPEYTAANAEVERVKTQRDDINQRLTSLLGNGTVEVPDHNSLLQVTNAKITTIKSNRETAANEFGEAVSDISSMRDSDGVLLDSEEKTANDAKLAAEAAQNKVTGNNVSAVTRHVTTAQTQAVAAGNAAQTTITKLKTAAGKFDALYGTNLADTLPLPNDNLPANYAAPNAGSDGTDIDDAKGQAESNATVVRGLMTVLTAAIDPLIAAKPDESKKSHLNALSAAAAAVNRTHALAKEAWTAAHNARTVKLSEVQEAEKANVDVQEQNNRIARSRAILEVITDSQLTVASVTKTLSDNEVTVDKMNEDFEELTGKKGTDKASAENLKAGYRTKLTALNELHQKLVGVLDKFSGGNRRTQNHVFADEKLKGKPQDLPVIGEPAGATISSVMAELHTLRNRVLDAIRDLAGLGEGPDGGPPPSSVLGQVNAKINAINATADRVQKLNTIKNAITTAATPISTAAVTAVLTDDKPAILAADFAATKAAINTFSNEAGAEDVKTNLASYLDRLKAKRTVIDAVLNGPEGNNGIRAKRDAIAADTEERAAADGEVAKVEAERLRLTTVITDLEGDVASEDSDKRGGLIALFDNRVAALGAANVDTATANIETRLNEVNGVNNEAKKTAATTANNNIDAAGQNVTTARREANDALTAARDANTSANNALAALRTAVISAKGLIALAGNDAAPTLVTDVTLTDVTATPSENEDPEAAKTENEAAFTNAAENAQSNANAVNAMVGTLKAALETARGQVPAGVEQERIQGALDKVGTIADKVKEAFDATKTVWDTTKTAWVTKLAKVVDNKRIADEAAAAVQRTKTAITKAINDARVFGANSSGTVERNHNNTMRFLRNYLTAVPEEDIATEEVKEHAKNLRAEIRGSLDGLLAQEARLVAVLGDPNDSTKNGILDQLASLGDDESQHVDVRTKVREVNALLRKVRGQIVNLIGTGQVNGQPVSKDNPAATSVLGTLTTRIAKADDTIAAKKAEDERREQVQKANEILDAIKSGRVRPSGFEGDGAINVTTEEGKITAESSFITATELRSNFLFKLRNLKTLHAALVDAVGAMTTEAGKFTNAISDAAPDQKGEADTIIQETQARRDAVKAQIDALIGTGQVNGQPVSKDNPSASSLLGKINAKIKELTDARAAEQKRLDDIEAKLDGIRNAVDNFDLDAVDASVGAINPTSYTNRLDQQNNMDESALEAVGAIKTDLTEKLGKLIAHRDALKILLDGGTVQNADGTSRTVEGVRGMLATLRTLRATPQQIRAAGSQISSANLRLRNVNERIGQLIGSGENVTVNSPAAGSPLRKVNEKLTLIAEVVPKETAFNDKRDSIVTYQTDGDGKPVMQNGKKVPESGHVKEAADAKNEARSQIDAIAITGLGAGADSANFTQSRLDGEITKGNEARKQARHASTTANAAYEDLKTALAKTVETAKLARDYEKPDEPGDGLSDDIRKVKESSLTAMSSTGGEETNVLTDKAAASANTVTATELLDVINNIAVNIENQKLANLALRRMVTQLKAMVSVVKQTFTDATDAWAAEHHGRAYKLNYIKNRIYAELGKSDPMDIDYGALTGQTLSALKTRRTNSVSVGAPTIGDTNRLDFGNIKFFVGKDDVQVDGGDLENRRMVRAIDTSQLPSDGNAAPDGTVAGPWLTEDNSVKGMRIKAPVIGIASDGFVSETLPGRAPAMVETPGTLRVNLFTDRLETDQAAYMVGGAWMYVSDQAKTLAANGDDDDMPTINDYGFGSILSIADGHKNWATGADVQSLTGVVQYEGPAAGFFVRHNETDGVTMVGDLDARIRMTANFDEGQFKGQGRGALGQIEGLTFFDKPGSSQLRDLGLHETIELNRGRYEFGVTYQGDTRLVAIDTPIGSAGLIRPNGGTGNVTINFVGPRGEGDAHPEGIVGTFDFTTDEAGIIGAYNASKKPEEEAPQQ